jgi:phage tail sheath protein FI
MAERVSTLGQTPRGLVLLSDVTTSLDEGYRPACVNRLVTALVRAARRVGEDLVFEPSGEVLWGRIRERLQRLLAGLFQDGALRGATPTEAFQVRCDRSTMSQNDLDAGRVIVTVQFQASLPIERITVALGLHEGGQVSVLSSDGGSA